MMFGFRQRLTPAVKCGGNFRHGTPRRRPRPQQSILHRAGRFRLRSSWREKLRFTCNLLLIYQSILLQIHYEGLMKKLTLVLLASMALSTFAAETKVQGYLVDLACAREEGQKPGFGAKHSKDCLK